MKTNPDFICPPIGTVRLFVVLWVFLVHPRVVHSIEWVVEVDTLGLGRVESPAFYQAKLPPNCRVDELLEDGTELPCVSQQDSSGIHWILSGETHVTQKRRFRISEAKGGDKPSSGIQVVVGPEEVVFQHGNRHVLSYRTAWMPAPPGVNPLYGKSGFVHPLKTPKGFVVTAIQPKDHIHHYGLWHPWTHTHVDGKPVDFWNLGMGQGTCRFDEILEVESGPVWGRLKVRQAYEVILNAESFKRLLAVGRWPGTYPEGICRGVLDEVLELRLWYRPGDESGFLLDYDITQTCRPGVEFSVDAYRYSGFGVRATQLWDNDNSGYLTDLGKDRFNANATRARWGQIYGRVSGSDAGILMLSSAQNREHPEFIRIWDHNANGGKANCFFNFNPVQERDWTLEPGQSFKRMYRIYLHDLRPDQVDADGFWNDYRFPPRVRLIQTSNRANEQ